jgi:hypothetical protein
MPRDRYDFWRGETDLTPPVDATLDGAITAACEAFRACDGAARDEFRRGLSRDDCYSLMNFAVRSAALAIRDKLRERVEAGATALAMIAAAWVDPREISWPFSYLCLAATCLGVDETAVLRKAALMADDQVAAALRQFLSRKWQTETSGLVVVATPGGDGIISKSIFPYAPSVPLEQAVAQLAAMIRADEYQPTVTCVGADLPRHWLEGTDDEALDDALRSVTGGASVTAVLRPGEGEDRAHQVLMAFLVEVRQPAAGEVLGRLAMERRSRASHVLLPVKEGRLFCLLAGRATLSGKPSFETATSIERFLDPVSAILRGIWHGRG